MTNTLNTKSVETNKSVTTKKTLKSKSVETKPVETKKADSTKLAIEKRLNILESRGYPAAVKSLRDKAYFKFFVEQATNKTLTIEKLQSLKTNPHYAGSNKADDAGIISRFERFGLIEYKNGVIKLISDSFEPMPAPQNNNK